MSENAQRDDRNPAREAKQQRNGVGDNGVARGRRMIELIVFAFLGLAAISGGFLGVFSLLGYWQNKETWAIWTLYCVIVFTITAGFLNWQKRIWEQPRPQAESSLPHIYMTGNRFVGGITAGKPVVVEFVFHNNGADAENVTVAIGHTLREASDHSTLSCFATPIGEEITAVLPTGGDIHAVGTLNFQMTEQRFQAIQNESYRLLAYGAIRYEHGGKKYAVPFCRQFDKSFADQLGFCPSWFKCESEK